MRKTKRKTYPRSRQYLVPHELGFSKGRRSNVVRQRTLTAYPSDKKTKETWPSSPHDISIAAKVFFKVATERDRLVKGCKDENHHSNVCTRGVNIIKAPSWWRKKYISPPFEKAALSRYTMTSVGTISRPPLNTPSPPSFSSLPQPLQDESTYLWQVLGAH